MVRNNILKGPFHHEALLKLYKLLSLSKYNSKGKKKNHGSEITPKYWQLHSSLTSDQLTC